MKLPITSLHLFIIFSITAWFIFGLINVAFKAPTRELVVGSLIMGILNAIIFFAANHDKQWFTLKGDEKID